MKTLPLETRKELAKKEIEVLQSEYKVLAERQSALKVPFGKKGYQHTREYRIWKNNDSEMRKLDNKIEYLKYGVSLVKSLVNKIIPESIKTYTTAVRGWHNYSSGKRVTPGLILIRGSLNAKKIPEIIKVLEENGYEILDKDKISEARDSWVTGYVAEVKFNPIVS